MKNKNTPTVDDFLFYLEFSKKRLYYYFIRYTKCDWFLHWSERYMTSDFAYLDLHYRPVYLIWEADWLGDFFLYMQFFFFDCLLRFNTPVFATVISFVYSLLLSFHQSYCVCISVLWEWIFHFWIHCRLIFFCLTHYLNFHLKSLPHYSYSFIFTVRKIEVRQVCADCNYYINAMILRFKRFFFYFI